LNLLKSHEDLSNFDSNLKVKPLLRDKKDQKALVKGLSTETLDYISSNHYPLEIEKKHLEYPYASHGAIGLETCFAALNTASSKDFGLETIIHKLSIGPRKALGIDIPELKVGETAKITIFDPTIKWTNVENDILSISKNSPFIDEEFQGKVVGTINGSHVYRV
jgi:dihydroorotase